MKVGTIALVIRYQRDIPELLDILSDEKEIHLLQAAVESKEPDPIAVIRDFRAQQSREEEDFGDYVEELLSQPFVRQEILDHGLQWLRSKIKIEQYQRTESDAAKVIADFAYKVFSRDPSQTDFILAGPANQVRVRIFVVAEPVQLAA